MRPSESMLPNINTLATSPVAAMCAEAQKATPQRKELRVTRITPRTTSGSSNNLSDPTIVGFGVVTPPTIKKKAASTTAKTISFVAYSGVQSL